MLLTALIPGFFWKLLTRQFTWMDHPDMAYQVLPWFQYQAASWQRGEFPLWDPNVWAGQPLFGLVQPGAAYPPNWLLFLLPMKKGHIDPFAVQLSFVFAHWAAAVFAFWLGRDLGRSPAASILCALAFAIGGVLGSLAWPQHFSGAMWIPLVLLFFLRYRRGSPWRVANAALAGGFLGLAFLAGHHQIPMCTGFLLAALWIAEAARERRWQVAAPACVCAAMAMLTSAFQTLPGVEFGRHAVRFVGLPSGVGWNQSVPYSVHQQFSLLPSSLLGLALPNVPGDGVFVGLSVLVLAAIGLFANWRESEPRLFGWIAGAGTLFALGGFSVFHGVFYLLIPMADKARFPAMAFIVAQTALAVLASYGLDAARSDRWSPRWPRALAIAGTAAWIVVAVAVSLREERSREYEHLAVFGIAAFTLAAVLYFPRDTPQRARLASWMLPGLLLFELGTVVTHNYYTRDQPGGYLKRLEADADIAGFLRTQPDLVRLDVDTEAVPYNIGDWYGFPTFRAYLGGVTQNVARAEIAGVAERLFAITHYLAKTPRTAAHEEIFRGATGVNVYRIGPGHPEAWVVHRAEQVPASRILARPDEIYTTAALLTAPPPALEPCTKPDSVLVTERAANRVVLQADIGCRGLVILSHTYFPGWHATVDGRPTRIHEAFGVLRAVVVDRGSHRIEMRFAPWSVGIGAAMTAGGMLLMIVLLALTRRRSQEESASVHDLAPK